MFVVPSARGSGAAQALLARIEDEARAAGLPLLTLETGTRSEAALRAYEKWGLTRCDAFGDYVGMPVHALATSVFMRKAIA
jgi:putative acetyltransferase